MRCLNAGAEIFASRAADAIVANGCFTPVVLFHFRLAQSENISRLLLIMKVKARLFIFSVVH